MKLLWWIITGILIVIAGIFMLPLLSFVQYKVQDFKLKNLFRKGDVPGLVK